MDSESLHAIQNFDVTEADASLIQMNTSLLEVGVPDSGDGKAADCSLGGGLSPLPHDNLDMKYSAGIEHKTEAQTSNTYDSIHSINVDSMDNSMEFGTSIDKLGFELAMEGTTEYIDTQSTVEEIAPAIMQPLQSAPKRKQHYWKQCDWRNLPMVRFLRENTLWSESPDELPSCYSRPSYLSNSDGDPRGIMKIGDFARVLNLVTHNEANAYAVQHSQPVKRKRLATLNVKYDFSGEWGRRKLKSSSKESPPVLKKEKSEVVSRPGPNDQCSMCLNTKCNISCDFCTSIFHVECLRVSGSRAPDPDRLRGCPRCVSRTRPPKLHAFNKHDKSIADMSQTQPRRNRRPSQRAGERKLVRSGIKKPSLKELAVSKIKAKLVQRRQLTVKKAQTSVQNSRASSKRIALQRKISKSKASNNEFAVVNQLPSITNASAGPSWALQSGFSRKTIIVCNKFPTKSDKTDTPNRDGSGPQALKTSVDFREDLKTFPENSGISKSKKYRAFVRKAERVFTNEASTRPDGTALSDLLTKYESLHMSSSLLDSFKKNTEWQSRVQRGIMGEWNAAMPDDTTPIKLLQNLKANIAATIALTDDFAAALGRGRNKSRSDSTSDSF